MKTRKKHGGKVPEAKPEAESLRPVVRRSRLENLKAKAYLAPALATLAGPALADDTSPEGIIPIFGEGIPTLGGVGLTLLVGGLAAAGGIMVYKKNQARLRGEENPPDGSSKK